MRNKPTLCKSDAQNVVRWTLNILLWSYGVLISLPLFSATQHYIFFARGVVLLYWPEEKNIWFACKGTCSGAQFGGTHNCSMIVPTLHIMWHLVHMIRKWLKIFETCWSNNLKVVFQYSDVALFVGVWDNTNCAFYYCAVAGKWVVPLSAEQLNLSLVRTTWFHTASIFMQKFANKKSMYIKGSRGDLAASSCAFGTFAFIHALYHVNFPQNFPISRDAFKGAGTES